MHLHCMRSCDIAGWRLIRVAKFVAHTSYGFVSKLLVYFKFKIVLEKNI